MKDSLNKTIIHLRTWLNENTVFKVSNLEKAAAIPKGELYHFIKNRRDLPEKHISNLEQTLKQYGYVPLKEKR